MPFDGTGIFHQIHNWVTDKANGVLVTASRFQATYDDMAQGLSNCFTRDGQSPALTDLPMNGYRVVNMGNGVGVSDAVNLSQLNSIASTLPIVYLATAARAGSTQLITADGTGYNIIFNSITLDPHGEFNAITGLFTTHMSGIWEVHVGVRCYASIPAGISIFIRVNGGAADVPVTTIAPANSLVNPTYVNTSTAMFLGAGVTIGAAVAATGGGTITVDFPWTNIQILHVK